MDPSYPWREPRGARHRLYRRHRWRSEGFHGEAKGWHGLARAVRRGLRNMRIQAFLTAAAVNLKRLAAALVALLGPRLGPQLVSHLLAVVTATSARRRAAGLAIAPTSRAA